MRPQVVAGLWGLGSAFGALWLVCLYIMPLLVVNHWCACWCTPLRAFSTRGAYAPRLVLRACPHTRRLVMITMLQHTHPSLPHYGDAEWDWLRGALATVDRSYG